MAPIGSDVYARTKFADPSDLDAEFKERLLRLLRTDPMLVRNP
jgi:hypothetical protein